MFLLSAAGGLSVSSANLRLDLKSCRQKLIPSQIYRLPSLVKPVYEAAGLSFLPPFLSTEFSVRRSSAKEVIAELLVAELGDVVHKAPYMIVSFIIPLASSTNFI